MIIPIFRPTTADFRKWCKEYVGLAFSIVQTHEKYPLLGREEEHAAAKKLCRQYKVLLASLDNDTRQIFENTIMKNKAIHFSVKEERIAFSTIFRHWQEICFPENKHPLNSISKEQVGARLKELRIMNGYTRQQIADITGIGVPTLKSYENGDRMIRLDAAYLLAQVYGVSVNGIVN